MPLLSITLPQLIGVIEALPGAFSDEDFFARLIELFPIAYAREVGDQARVGPGGADGFLAARDEVIAALQSAPLSFRVKPTLPGEWKRLDDVPPETLPGPPDVAILRRKFERPRPGRPAQGNGA